MKLYRVENFPNAGYRNFRVVETSIDGAGCKKERELCICQKEDDAYAIEAAMEEMQKIQENTAVLPETSTYRRLGDD